jgi:hypothetical protein
MTTELNDKYLFEMSICLYIHGLPESSNRGVGDILHCIGEGKRVEEVSTFVSRSCMGSVSETLHAKHQWVQLLCPRLQPERKGITPPCETLIEADSESRQPFGS